MTNVLLHSPAMNDLVQTTRPTHTLSKQAAVVVNASKFTLGTLSQFRADLDSAFNQQGWLAPLWLPTTAESRGIFEARAAVSAGADVVLVAGGDGTIRTVAQELAGSDTPMALLPMGTGNLLARNLGIPRKDLQAAVAIAIQGNDRRIDMGWLEIDPTGNGTDLERHAFLVMAGAGFDAATMSGADHAMKSRLGPFAYLVSGARAIRQKMVSTTVTVDGTANRARAARGIIVGNCGSLTMGLALMPDADPRDGQLDGVVFHQRTILDWARVAWSVATRSRRTSGLMPRLRGTCIEVTSDTPQLVEVDGDVIGESRSLRFELQADALLVRCSRTA